MEIIGNTLKFKALIAVDKPVDTVDKVDVSGAMSDNSSNWIIDNMNKASDWVVGKEVELVFKPLGAFLKQACIDLFLYIQTNIPEIVGMLTILAGGLIMIGMKFPKVLPIYGVVLIIATFWKMA